MFGHYLLYGGRDLREELGDLINELQLVSDNQPVEGTGIKEHDSER